MWIPLTWVFVALFYISGSSKGVTIITSETYIIQNTCFNITCEYGSVINDRSTIFHMTQGSTVVYTATIRSIRTNDFCAINNLHHCKDVGICSCDADGLATHLCYNHTTGETGILNIKCQTNEGNFATDRTVASAPNTKPVISQSPPGNITSGDNVTLTCSVSGGNPLAVLSWNCTGKNNNKTSGNTASYSVDFTVDKSFNGRICTCSGSHPVSSYRPTVQHKLVVYSTSGQDILFEPQEYAYVIKDQSLTFTYRIITGLDKWRVTELFVNDLVTPVIRLAPHPDNPSVCRFAAAEPPAIYSYTCNASTGVMTFTIDPVSQSFNGYIARCRSSFGPTADDIITKESQIVVTAATNTIPVISQSPPGPIISGNKVTLICSVSGGNPLVVLSWNCTGNYNNNTSGNTTSYSVDFTVDKTYNNKICTCSGSHPISSYRPTVHHKLEVYYAPDIKPTVKQTPKGVIVPGNKVMLTCSVSGGHPLAVLVWDCTSTNTNNTSGNQVSYSIEFYTNTTYNNRICTCSATHPVTSYRPLVQHKLVVYFSPQYIQIEEGKEFFTAGISSLVIGVLALALAIVFISCWRLRMKKKSKSEDHYTEFNTKASTETVAYDVINHTTSIDDNRPSIEDKDRGVYSNDECQPYSTTTDHTPSDKSQQPKVSGSSQLGEEYDYVKI